jgi:DNA end-binding protein Ku
MAYPLQFLFHMNALWKGSISFGLVNIPVQLFSAVDTTSQTRMHLVHKKDGGRIRYARICTKENEEVPYSEITKGISDEEGETYKVDPKTLKSLKKKASEALEISQFIDQSEVDETLYDTVYYLEPLKGAAKPYALLRSALKESGKAGLCRFVLREKEHIALIETKDNVLLLWLLYFPSQIRKTSGLDLPSSRTQFDKRSLKMALELIDQLTDPFEPETFIDEREEKLRSIKGEIEKPAKSTSRDNVIDLMSALKASLSGKPKSRARKGSHSHTLKRAS